MITEGIIHNPTNRVITILNYVASCESGVSLSDIAKSNNIPLGTIHPIIQQLVASEYLSLNNDTGKYSIGLRLFLNGSVFLQSSTSLASINAILRSLSDKTGETSHFAKLEGGNVLYLSKAETSESIRMYSAIGKMLPAYGTGLGKALLSQKSFSDLQMIYPNGLTAITPHTITSVEALYNQLQDIKKTGFAYEWEESNLGVTCIAKPIFKCNSVCAAISVGIPVFRFSEEKKKSIEKFLSEAALQLEDIVKYLDFI